MTTALGWCDKNMQRVYPLDDNATCISASGAALPQSFLSDIQILTPKLEAGPGIEGFYISAIIRNENSVRIEISYQLSAGDDPILCAQTGDIDIDTVNTDSVAGRTKPLSNVQNQYPWLSSIGGYIVIGTCRDMKGLGTMTFDYAATRIIGVRVYECMSGINSVTFTDGNTTHVMYDDFTIRAGDGVAFDVNGTEVTVRRIKTAEEEAATINDPSSMMGAIYRALGTPIRTINGLAPDDDMNFTVSNGDCVSVQNAATGIVIANPCAQPCCDDASTDDVNTSLSLLEEASKRLEAYYSALTENINNMQARLSALIASRR